MFGFILLCLEFGLFMRYFEFGALGVSVTQAAREE